jgi:uncharacterized repeat protein (TIGR01451 family)
MSGTLTASSPSCLIAANQSNCIVYLNWNTINPVAISAVTSTNGSTVASGNLGSVPATIYFGGTNFYLYNNAVLLNQTSVTASCVGESTWNGNMCSTTSSQTPTVTLYANGATGSTTITSGQPAALTWNSTNATSCTGTGFSTGNQTNSSQTVWPGSSTTYSINCVNSSGQSANSVVTVNVNGGGYTNPPTVYLNASPTIIQSGQSSYLNWSSTNATSCYGSWTANTSISGSQTVWPSYTTNYTITCYGQNGQQVSDSRIVYVNNITTQTCQDPSASNYGGTLPCNYFTQTCQDPNSINYRGILPCRYNNIIVNNQPTVVLYADQATVPSNGAATVRWITTNATSCNASGGSIGWAGAKNIGPGSFYTGSLTSSKTYYITCSNDFGSSNDSVTVNVRGETTTVINPVPKTSNLIVNSSINSTQPITPTIDNTRPHPGDEINYTVNYQNIGTGAIANLTLVIPLPLQVSYLSSNPNNPNFNGNTLTFNLGSLKANGQGEVTVRTRVQDNIPDGTNLNFPATFSYLDASGQSQTASANVSAQVVNSSLLGANVLGAGFLPTSLFGWLLLLILILVLVFLAKHALDQYTNKKIATANVPTPPEHH